MPLVDHALAYAAKGIPVFPLRPGSKVPLPGSAGFKDSTCSEEQIRAWWEATPEANIGIPTGVVFEVLDVDGFEGGESLEEWAEANGGDDCIPKGPTVYTPSGGFHIYVGLTGHGNRAGMLAHVDWRGKGGYVVAVPSVVDGKTYRWGVGTEDRPYPPVEPPLAALVAKEVPAPLGERRALRDRLLARQAFDRAADGGYGETAIAREVENVLRATEGTRNHTLNAAAFSLYQLAQAGELSFDDVTDRLTSAARQIGLGGTEIDRTLHSALVGAVDNPRPADRLPERRVDGSGRSGVLSQASSSDTSDQPSVESDEEAVNPLRASRRTLFELWQYPDPSPLVAETLMLDSLALLWGKPGAKKSFTALDLSLCVATGNWWHGKETKQGTVLYFVGEGLSGIKQRTKAWMMHHKLTLEPEGWFSYGRAFDLLSRDAVAWAIEEAADLNPSLIVLDTLHRHSLGANENDSRDVGRMVESLDALRATTGACILTIHHSNKGGDDERGHSSLLGAVDTSIKVTSDEVKTELAWKKMKDGPTPDQRTFYTLPVEHTGSIVLDDQYHGTADVLEPAIRSVSAVLDECAATGLNVENLSHETGLSEGQVARALTRMLDDGEVRKSGYRWFPN